MASVAVNMAWAAGGGPGDAAHEGLELGEQLPPPRLVVGEEEGADHDERDH